MADTKRGRLGVSELTAKTNTAVYEVTSAMDSKVNIHITNPVMGDASVNVAIVDGTAVNLATEDYVLYKEPIRQYQEKLIEGVHLNADEAVVVYSSLAGVIVRVDGVEEDEAVDVSPSIKKLTSQALAFGDFTDNEDATGYIDFTTGTLPVGAVVLGWKAIVSEGFASDTSAAISVGVEGDLDAYSADTTASVLTAGTVGSGVLAATAATPIAAVSTPRVTVTGGADFTSIDAGSMVIEVYYLSTSGAVVDSNPTVSIASIESQALAVGDFTDNTNTTGYIDFTSNTLPAGAIVLGWKAVTSTGFTGDTTATVQVGVSGDVDAYSADTTGSCLAAGTVGSMALANVAATPIASVSTPRVTVTGSSDFGLITAGEMIVTMYYITTG